MLDFHRFRVLTFDCYGTLIDWESGILAALRPLMAAHGKSLTDEKLLELYGELEAEAEAGEYQSYRKILEAVARGFGKRLGFEASEQEARSLPESLKNWQPFPDTVAALGKLKSRFKLAIVSNTDDDLFADTARLLQVPFDWVITAQQAGSYKPSERNFRLALERIALPPDAVLHCAQSIYHDIVPARELGLATVWVNRRAGRTGEGATKAAQGQPDLEVPDLKTLAEMAT
ncbi:MAG TPA: haloacid dehalogenase type II [Terriglobales bacterium]|nr:haloacid dehalogenase type II [Terriglobales bacterium]